MIRAVLELTNEGNFIGFTVKGHSGSAPAGKDIICAAVSAIVQTALIGLDEVADVRDTYEISDGLVRCRLPENMDKKSFDAVQIIINVMWLGLKSIAEEYPDFVRIKED